MGVFSRTVRDSSPDPVGLVASAADYDAVRPITASAARVNLNNNAENDRFRKMRSSAAWQTLAWDYYDAVGEVKYAFTLMSAVISRIRLYAGAINPDGSAVTGLAELDGMTETIAEVCVKALEELFRANSMATMLRDSALNLSVTGECYLIHEKARLGDRVPARWSIMSVDQLKVASDGKVTIQRSRGGAKETLPKTTFVGRIWRQHPRYSDDADSSMMGILDLCDELLLLNRAARAIEKSRLNAGALYLPDGLSMAGGPGISGEDQEASDEAQVSDEDDEFEQELMASISTPIQDEDSASAVVPLIIRGPADLGDKIKQFKFERSFDEAMNARAERVLERILNAIDVPKDVVTGLANIKYANAVQINESMYRAHIEPLVLMICDSLTTVYLRPVLRAVKDKYGIPDSLIDSITVWYDPSEIVIKPDKGTSADAGFDRNLLSEKAWRSAHGFSDDDKPSDDEILKRIMLERGQLSPQVTEALLKRIDPGLMADVLEQSQADSAAPIPSDVQDVLDGGIPAPPQEPTPPPVEPSSDTTGMPPGRPAGPSPTVNPRAPLEERTTAPIS